MIPGEEGRTSIITALDLEGPEPTIAFDATPPLTIAPDPQADEGRDEQIAAYAQALRIGDRVRWGEDEDGRVAWVQHPRPTIDAITLAWMRRAGADLSTLAEEAEIRATVWHPPGPRDWLHRFGEDDSISVACWKGELRLSQLTQHPSFIELRGPYLIVDADFLPETVKTAMVGDAFAGRRLDDLIDGLPEHCGLSGDETIASIDVREGFETTVVNLVAGPPTFISDLRRA